MGIWIALIRGINVGGRNIVKMAELKNALVQSGHFSQAVSYIQSGNLVVRTDLRSKARISDHFKQVLRDRFDVQTSVQVFQASQFEKILSSCPDFDSNEKFVHLFLHATKPKSVDHEKVERLKSPTESVSIGENATYVHAPDGVGRSKLFAAMESILGVTTTARNLKTANKLLTMANEID